MVLTQCDLAFLWPVSPSRNTEQKAGEIWWGQIPYYTHSLYLSLICHWLFLLRGTSKEKHSLWFSVPSTGALADPPAVILDFSSAAPESPPKLIQGHSFYKCVLEKRSQPFLGHAAISETAEPVHCISIMLPVCLGVEHPYVHFSILVQ